MTTKWNEAARLRNSQIESGIDITFCELFVPYYRDRVVQLMPARVLEVGCGTGHLAKALVSSVPEFVALEPSSDMNSVAEDVLRGTGVVLHKVLLEDFTAQKPFDLIIAHAVVQLVAEPDPFFVAMARAVARTGKCVFSLPHPCFWNNYREYIPRDRFRYMQHDYAEATLTITKDPEHAITGVPYYHRPLQDYVKVLADAGLGVIDMDEIYPKPGIEAKYGCTWNEPRYVVLTCETRV